MLKVRTMSANNVFGMRFFEIVFEDEKGNYVATSDVTLTTLKELNITKSLNGFEKVRTWAESEEGQKFLFESEEN